MVQTTFGDEKAENVGQVAPSGPGSHHRTGRKHPLLGVGDLYTSVRQDPRVPVPLPPRCSHPDSVVTRTFRISRRSAGSGSVKDQGEVHVCGTTGLDLADVSPRCVVCSPQVDRVIAGCQREPIRLSEM